MSEIKNRSGLWYLLPLIFGIIGAVIAWFIIKDNDPKKAGNCLKIGLVLLVIEILFGFTLF